MQAVPRLGVLCAALALATASPAAHAWRLNYVLGFGVEHSDNVARTDEDTASDNILLPTFGFSLDHRGERLTLSAVGLSEYRYYAQDSFDDEFRLELGARANVMLLPERLAWIFDDYLTQEPINVFTTGRPDNLQRTNVFATGPSVTFRFSPAMSSRFDLRYVDTYAEETESFNSSRVAGAARLLRKISDPVTLSLNLEGEAVRLDDESAQFPDYDRWLGYGRYNHETSRYRLDVDLGWNRVNYDAGDDPDGLLARLEYEWELDLDNTLRARAAHQLSDSAYDLLLAAPETDSLELPVTASRTFLVGVSGDVVKEERIGGDYVRRNETASARISGYIQDLDYQRNNDLDESGGGVFGSYDYNVTRRNTLGAFAGYLDQSFDTVGRDEQERTFGIRWRYQVLRQVRLHVELSHASRNSNQPAGGFDEMRAYAGISYVRNR